LNFLRYIIIISFSLKRKFLKTINFSNKLNSFLRILLIKIGINGIRGITINIIINNGINKVQTRNTHFLRFGADF